ncbi:capsid decoration protein [Escherichia phage fBC-Eco01]|nr:capsid decoration protein [Escherichia phage fBC-Eco01]
MVDVIKRRITGVSADTVGAKIDMANISPASFSTPLATTTTYAKASTTTADSGTYKVVVDDVYGNIISSSTVATVS